MCHDLKFYTYAVHNYTSLAYIGTAMRFTNSFLGGGALRFLAHPINFRKFSVLKYYSKFYFSKVYMIFGRGSHC